jgi:GT2 family glycosyltransferase
MGVTHSLVIPVHNGSEFIHLFWDSLIPNISDKTEIIVVDDGSSEDIGRLIPKLPSNLDLNVFRNESAQGYSQAVNRGLREASGEYVYLLNTDLILGRGALALIVSYLKQDSRIGVVGAKLLYPQSGKIQHFGLAFTQTRKFHIFTHMDSEHALVCELGDFQAVTFALCGFRRALLKEVGYLDPNYCNGSEDIDFSLRVKKNGYRLVVPPEVASYHWESLSGNSRHVATLENEARFWGNWAKEIKPDIEHFIGMSLALFLQHNPQYRATDFTIVNLSFGNDFHHLLNVFEIHFTHYRNFDFWDYSRPFRKGDQLWLAMTLPFDTLRNPKPFLFIVQEYPQLMQNHYWFKTRREFCDGDLVIDHYGNIMRASEPNFSSLAFRQKSVMDVS